MKTIKTGLMFDNQRNFIGYAELYEEKFQNTLGDTCVKHVLGSMYLNLEDKPQRVEYPISTHKHIGTVKVKLELL